MATKRVGIGTVTKEMRDKFESYCDNVGFLKSRAIEGAITAFMQLSTEQQIELMKKSNEE